MTPSLQDLQVQFERLVAQNPLPPLAALAPAATAPAAPPPSPQVEATDLAACGVHLDVRLRSDQVVDAAKLLRFAGFALDAVTGVDWIAQQEMEVVYDYFHPDMICRVAVHARIPRGQPEIPTISPIFDGANWHERETHEFFGITFIGHPNLIPILLPEDATFHPLRKDFTGP